MKQYPKDEYAFDSAIKKMRTSIFNGTFKLFIFSTQQQKFGSKHPLLQPLLKDLKFLPKNEITVRLHSF